MVFRGDKHIYLLCLWEQYLFKYFLIFIFILSTFPGLSDEVIVYLFVSVWFWWELMSILHSAYPALNSWPSPVNCTTHSPLLLSWWQLHPSRYPGQTLSVLHGSFPLIAVSKLSGNPLGSTFQIPPEPDHLPGPWLLPVRASIILGDSKGSQLVSPLLPSASYNPFSAEQPEWSLYTF